jgi:hypothetical protein
VRISASITSLRLNFPETVFVPLITELLSLAQAGTQQQRLIAISMFSKNFAT